MVAFTCEASFTLWWTEMQFFCAAEDEAEEIL